MTGSNKQKLFQFRKNATCVENIVFFWPVMLWLYTCLLIDFCTTMWEPMFEDETPRWIEVIFFPVLACVGFCTVLGEEYEEIRVVLGDFWCRKKHAEAEFAQEDFMLAILMGQHTRLGEHSVIWQLDEDCLHLICEFVSKSASQQI